jgi:hypothetical protein
MLLSSNGLADTWSVREPLGLGSSAVESPVFSIAKSAQEDFVLSQKNADLSREHEWEKSKYNPFIKKI